MKNTQPPPNIPKSWTHHANQQKNVRIKVCISAHAITDFLWRLITVLAWYDKVKAVKTVEEKQIKINMPKYYGFMCFMQTEDLIPYDSLELAQHITRTHLMRDMELPELYSKIVVDDSLLSAVKSDVEEAVLLEHDGYVYVGILWVFILG